jgi:hypothetical protein
MESFISRLVHFSQHQPLVRLIRLMRNAHQSFLGYLHLFVQYNKPTNRLMIKGVK